MDKNQKEHAIDHTTMDSMQDYFLILREQSPDLEQCQELLGSGKLRRFMQNHLIRFKKGGKPLTELGLRIGAQRWRPRRGRVGDDGAQVLRELEMEEACRG